ncbi:MAG: Gfo/Idh/MocA family oxidoreductase [Trueperaceae bacterium]|nr:Gfo/Idh/MocA family oxidoreductase [Trueperaceae bacterium]
MKKLKLGLIGCGNISPLYLKSARHFEGLEFIACSDLNLELAHARAKEFDIPEVLSVDELLVHPEVECIVNLTIPAAHAEIAKRALNAGKHVYNEKPLAARLEDAQEIVALAKSKGLRLACAPSTFLGATVQTAKQALADGMIGEPIAANAFFMSHGMEHWHPNPESFYQPGAGPMFDMGPYYLTALVNLLGSVKSVTASARISFPERTISSEPKSGQTFKVNTPTHIAGTLEFMSGAIATVITSFDVWHTQMPKFEIYGAEGTLSLEMPNMFGVKVELRKAQDKDWQTLPFVSEFQDFEASWALALADLAWAIEEDRPHRASSEQALHVLELMQAFLKSAELGKKVEIDSRLP